MFNDIKKDVEQSANPPSMSGHYYQESIIKGLRGNGLEISVLNAYRIRPFPNYKKIVFQRSPFYIDNELYGMNIPFINLPVLDSITQFFSLLFHLIRSLKNNEKTYIFCFNTYLTQTLVLLLLKAGYRNIEICDVIGDIHGKYGVPNQRTGIMYHITNFMEFIQDKLAAHYDLFIVHTKAMLDALGIKNKPFLVMECPFRGTVEDNISFPAAGKYKIVYTGALQEEYGITHLLNAFQLLGSRDYELLIAGSGIMAADLKAAAGRNPQIRYFGFVAPRYRKEITGRSFGTCESAYDRVSVCEL